MNNLAEKHLADWTIEYDETEGEVDAPRFDLIATNYTDDKELPHYVFDDNSVLIAFINYIGQTQYEAYENSGDLEESRELESGTLHGEYALINVCLVNPQIKTKNKEK
jgi:hypothetical protein